MQSVRENNDAIASCSAVHIRNDNLTSFLSKQNEKFSIRTETLVFNSFEAIADAIGNIFPRFENEPHSLIALMTCRKRRFFLPMLYALVKLLKTTFFYNSRRLVSCLWNEVFERYRNEDGIAWVLLKNMETEIDLQLVEDVSEKFSFDTIIYCAMNGGQLFEWEVEDETVLTYDEKIQLRLRLWYENVKEDLLYCSNVQEVVQIVQWIVKICFPSVSTTKNRVFIWDPFDEVWCLVTDLTELLHIILELIWNTLNEFMFNENIKMEQKVRWSQMHPQWLHIAKIMAKQEKEKQFKVFEDIYKIRRMEQDRILGKLSIEHKSANVPELYFLEEQNMKLVIPETSKVNYKE